MPELETAAVNKGMSLFTSALNPDTYAVRSHRAAYRAAALTHGTHPGDAVNTLKYAKEIVVETNSTDDGLNPGDVAMGDIFGSTATATELSAFCLDCFHIECLLTADILTAARQIVERHTARADHTPEWMRP